MFSHLKTTVLSCPTIVRWDFFFRPDSISEVFARSGGGRTAAVLSFDSEDSARDELRGFFFQPPKSVATFSFLLAEVARRLM